MSNPTEQLTETRCVQTLSSATFNVSEAGAWLLSAKPKISELGFSLITGFQTTHLKNKIKLIPTQHLRGLGLTLLAFPPHIPFMTSPQFGLKPSNLLSKESNPVMGLNPVQWVVG